MEYTLRMTDEQHATLHRHLFLGDGKEAMAFALCGQRPAGGRHVFTVHTLFPIPYDDCPVREPDRITWPTAFLEPLLQEAGLKNFSILKIHSHPGGYARFSEQDDRSDAELFRWVGAWLDDNRPHASAVMLPCGRTFGRAHGDAGVLGVLAPVMVVGDDLLIWHPEEAAEPDTEFALRQDQAFGKGTTRRLRKLTVAVAGCSGTGSIVVELLARHGVGKLVLIDPDRVEEKNVNRILNTQRGDAEDERFKVEVLADAVERIGYGQRAVPLPVNLMTPEAVAAIAECDLVFGCMDSAEGRHVLNRLASYYTLPYFDVGVGLTPDGRGSVSHVAGGVHYVKPGSPALVDRGLFTLEDVRAESLRRTDPERYTQERREGYLRGVGEDRPAVICVNTFYAALAVNDFLARIHPYRNQPNGDFSSIAIDLVELMFHFDQPELGDVGRAFARWIGRGDAEPLLGLPGLSG